VKVDTVKEHLKITLTREKKTKGRQQQTFSVRVPNKKLILPIMNICKAWASPFKLTSPHHFIQIF
jgi:hypothetical protein